MTLSIKRIEGVEKELNELRLAGYENITKQQLMRIILRAGIVDTNLAKSAITALCMREQVFMNGSDVVALVKPV